MSKKEGKSAKSGGFLPITAGVLLPIKNRCKITYGFWGFHNQKKDVLLYVF
jgi:hypothetical protein